MCQLQHSPCSRTLGSCGSVCRWTPATGVVVLQLGAGDSARNDSLMVVGCFFPVVHPPFFGHLQCWEDVHFFRGPFNKYKSFGVKLEGIRCEPCSLCVLEFLLTVPWTDIAQARYLPIMSSLKVTRKLWARQGGLYTFTVLRARANSKRCRKVLPGWHTVDDKSMRIIY